ncbi:MerR family transcriptional regulator [uncultured Desulfobacter sp.]|uniref:MerR family transcriptional regulator n=1 Tax=uncultured Desulfobacter sp. TaxID=240139 RepID=UPI002AAC33C8|nr:MerR family transcriptional regulator [uncultured Desulfobacter sp.]
MKTYCISQLARLFDLSRSTLLYYDRIGLLIPSDRSEAGYRLYTQRDRDRLAQICTLRNIGVALADIKKMLSSNNAPSVKILKNRLWEIGQQITDLRSQQQSIIRLLKEMTSDVCGPVIDKQMWVKMLQAAGMDEPAMMKWHAEFEFRSPRAHHDFLLSLGISKIEVKDIQSRSRMLIDKCH